MCKECGCGIADKKNPLFGKGAVKKAPAKKTPAKKAPAKKK
jgi:hypothetical protein